MSINYNELLDLFVKQSTARPATEIFQDIVSLAAKYGYEFIQYDRKLPFPLSRTEYATLGCTPSNTDGYESVVCRSDDYATRYQLIVRQPSSVSRQRQSHSAKVNGLSVCVHDTLGAAAWFTAIRAGTPIAKRKCLRFVVPLALVAHTLLSRDLDINSSKSLKPLTRREVEVLRWTGDGKTAGDIARILRVSENTVNFHLKSIKAKLGSSTKTSAVVQAALCGLLQ
ncbi:helix-turn-helix transcriptional regulator [Achromobacter xylosoxidans]|uniref:helix-turn-helix transcriptional regulator n=1 Tax=Alcaligenes xylosoxydans xylosoxydans TaxID=85698 RepID=UPI0009D75F4F|nr:helix-turn-helix transcriptional regulator [Achromobacter xylosoxidans]BEG75469.1 Transcriptional activator protein AnoR [Achromobacter xylosoxidans]